jgi:hypothetical protein
MENIQIMPFGKMSQELCPLREAVILQLCSRRSQKPRFQFLCLAAGQMPEWSEALGLLSLGECLTPVYGESPSAAVASFLWQVLERDVPAKYSLSKKACEGILRRAQKRGKELPPMLREALEAQCRAA